MKELVDTLKSKYKKYLKNEGKRLGRGFENVFQFDKDGRAVDLKLEVVSMLPKEIKGEILDCLKDKG